MDLILFNGTIHTVNEDQPVAEAVAIQNGRIRLVGDNTSVLALKTRETRLIDLEGRLVVPGFNDCHLHLLAHGINIQRMDCGGVTSIDELVERGKRFIKERNLAPGDWLLGYGWDERNYDEARMPTSEDLDRISTVHPIALTRVCVHSVLANGPAMERAGVTESTPQPAGGSFSVDAKKRPTGLFSETGRYLIYNEIPDPDVEEIKKILEQAATIAAEHGVTSIQSDDFEALNSKNWQDVIRAYTELGEEERLPVRVYQQCLLPQKERLAAFLAAGYTTGKGDDLYRIGPLKLLTDGSLGSRTAFLLEPYEDRTDTCGICVLSREELDALTDLAVENGMQLLYHAIGDAAMHLCFDAFSRVDETRGLEGARPGIVHCQVTDKALLSRFIQQDVLALVQPITLASDIHILDQRIGEKRSRHAYSYRYLMEKGVTVGLSSDCPVDSIDPLKNIYVATTRKDFNGFPETGWRPEECLSVEQAVYGLTMGAARCSFDEKVKGSIEQGKFADLAVLSDNIFEIKKEEIPNVRVCLTVMNGRVVHETA